MTCMSTGLCCTEAEKGPRHHPIGRLLTKLSIPYGIPLLDMPCTGSQGAHTEWRLLVHTAYNNRIRAARLENAVDVL